MSSIVMSTIATGHNVTGVTQPEPYGKAVDSGLDGRAPGSRVRELLAVLATLILLASLGALMVASTAA